MRAVLLALHYQNEVLHPDGRIRVGLDAASPVRAAVIGAAEQLLAVARVHAIPIVHVRVAFRPDYADLRTNAPIFRSVVALGAVREGSWGAAFYDTLAPREDDRDEFVVTHKRINAFYESSLETVLRALGATRLLVAGVATHSVVESTVRHAADMGYEVAVVSPACAAASPATHAAALASMSLVATICDDLGAAASFAAAEAV
jgi:nicotinamidase-related amidase